jgi:hypothetical protein
MGIPVINFNTNQQGILLMSEGIMEINPLMPQEDIRADRLSLPVVGLGLAALAKGVSQNTLNRTTDTPSGKVFAPTGEAIEPTQLPGMAPAEKLKGLPGLLGIELAKKLEGMSQASPTPKNKGFTTPASEDMKILHNVENEDDDTENTTTDKFITQNGVSVTNNLKTQNYLDDDLMNDLLKIRGGIEGHKKNMASAFPKMPNSTKNFMEHQLQKKLFDKYKIHEYPKGESPETVNEFRKKYLEDIYFKNLGAIEYITSVAYDVIGTKPKDSMLVVDEDGLPIAAAKISIPGRKDLANVSEVEHKDALVIVEAGSVFRNAGDKLFNDIIQKAKEEGRRFVVAEDLTSPEALAAMEKRGFRTPTTKDTKKFKGQKIRRPNGKSAVQKKFSIRFRCPREKSLWWFNR